ncbi:MAG: FAD-dependent oxidoreductase, partial [Leptolyngbyaceae bacterium]|nr:FAD-dependent oxidoreductase [Leptolyngbyaceae bacterium]
MPSTASLSTTNPSPTHTLTTDILVIGGGTGGTAAAIQAARRGALNGTQVTLVSEYPWLGGMLTTAGVSAPDGNELEAWQTGLWGQFIQAVQQRQLQGVDHGWVSCFTYEPRIGAAVLAAWVEALPNLQWIRGQQLRAVERRGKTLTRATFDGVSIQAKIILDGTELGDVLALAEIPNRWGWDQASQEPSAPRQTNSLVQKYPVQLPTWVVVLQDVGDATLADEIQAPPLDPMPDFSGAWDGYDPIHFLNYGRLPGDRFMINWPQQGNDYGVDLERLVQSAATREQFLQAAYWHSQAFAHHIQTQFGRRYGLATDTFPSVPNSLGGGAFALHPYYRESRRLVGVVTVTEADILPQPNRWVAALPRNAAGEVTAIAIGNYANDHHYPAPESSLLQLAPKSMNWGGRLTGTPFTLPYGCLVPETVDGLLVCEKNISVSHLANGATRLQPLVMNLGQAAGMAAALCIEANVQPRELAVRTLQNALLEEAIAPAAIMPLLNLAPSHPDWLYWQRYYLDRGDVPPDGNVPGLTLDFNRSEPAREGERAVSNLGHAAPQSCHTLTGVLERIQEHRYALVPDPLEPLALPQSLPLITLNPTVHVALQQWDSGTAIKVTGYWN